MWQAGILFISSLITFLEYDIFYKLLLEQTIQIKLKASCNATESQDLGSLLLFCLGFLLFFGDGKQFYI